LTLQASVAPVSNSCNLSSDSIRAPLSYWSPPCGITSIGSLQCLPQLLDRKSDTCARAMPNAREPEPINTFPGWQALGRNVNRGESALVLCMPLTRKRRGDLPNDNNDEANEDHTYTAFVYKPRWFVISQTSGEELNPSCSPEWNTERALAALEIEQIPFTAMDGNCQGYAKKRSRSIRSPNSRTRRYFTKPPMSFWVTRQIAPTLLKVD